MYLEHIPVDNTNTICLSLPATGTMKMMLEMMMFNETRIIHIDSSYLVKIQIAWKKTEEKVL